MPRVDGRLAVQGLLAGELGHQDLRQQPVAGDAALDRAARCGGLVATGASLFAPDVVDHLEGAVDDAQLLETSSPSGLSSPPHRAQACS